jgi:hypothetical protein
MDQHTAHTLIRQLAEGTDPHTGKAFAADSPYQHPDTVRALFVALRVLEGSSAQPAPAAETAAAPRKPRAPHAGGNGPSKVGQPWSREEDLALASAFDAGTPIPELATAHQRSRAGIEARLAKLGKITLPEGALRFKPRTAPAAQSPDATYEVKH